MKNISIGEFKTVYKESKKKETGLMISDDYSWAQTIRIPFKEFPEVKKGKINESITLVVSGDLSNMDEKGVSIKIKSMALPSAKAAPEEKKEESSSEFDKMKEKAKQSSGKKMAMKPGSGGLGKIFGGK